MSEQVLVGVTWEGGGYLQVVVVHLAKGLVVVRVVHLVQQLHRHTPAQPRLAHKHMLHTRTHTHTQLNTTG